MDELTSLLSQLLLQDLLIILVAGLIAGMICQRIRLPMVIGHLAVGALIGGSLLNFLPHPQEIETETAAVVETIHKNSEEGTIEESSIELHEATSKQGSVLLEQKILEELAHLGAVLLLFAIGIQFSPSELTRVWKYFTIGGVIQMFGVIIPITLGFWLCGYNWKMGLVIGSGASLSSTVLVFKSLEDMGQATASHGQRMVAILLFQDVATVPLLLMIPLLSMTSGTIAEMQASIFLMLLNSLLFVAFIAILRYLICARWIQRLATLKSVEILVLFSVVLMLLICGVAVKLGLPAALGGLAAGVVLSENRLTQQISAITLPFRESFSAIFFVSLGALFDYRILTHTPFLTIGAFFALLALKTAAGGLAFKLLGLKWKTALALGLGMSQLGELSFVILSGGASSGMFSTDVYQRMLFIALTSLIMTPLFLKIAFSQTSAELVSEGDEEHHSGKYSMHHHFGAKNAIVVGLGPIGSRVVSFLELSGVNVCLIDMNPINLHPYAQQGFRTVAGDATSLSSLQLAEISACNLFVITVPDDSIATEIVSNVRASNPKCVIFVRCRYIMNVKQIERAGANIVVVEEAETGGTMARMLERLI